MTLRLFGLLTILATLITFPAFALDLHQARASGLVGEQLDGYAVALKATPEVSALVADVNAKRKEEYARISKGNGQPQDVVAKLAAQQIISGLEAGSPYQATDGSWKKR
jgi:uncharacterized protein YdbL (DUF1318 family)